MPFISKMAKVMLSYVKDQYMFNQSVDIIMTIISYSIEHRKIFWLQLTKTEDF